MQILTEKILEHDELKESVVYFPNNGAVVRQRRNSKGVVTYSEILVRFVYANEETIKVIIEALKKHV